MIKRDKTIIMTARVVSLVFTPFYLPILGLIMLFTLSYLRQMPWPYKLQVLIMVYFFTVLLPTILINLYRRYHGWTLIQTIGSRSGTTTQATSCMAAMRTSLSTSTVARRESSQLMSSLS